MRSFLYEINKRNQLLFWFGFFCLIMFTFCAGLASFSKVYVEGKNIWGMPVKYYFSIMLTSWTIAWLLFYLQNKLLKRLLSIGFFISFFSVTTLIFYQSAKGQGSFFNFSSPFNALVHLLLVIFNLASYLFMIILGVAFFMQRKMPISQHYTWGIRLGILLFNFFLLIALLMLNIKGAIVGSEDVSGGIPLLDWSTKYGDLRIAFFLGIHSLQIIPLLSYYLFTKKIQVVNFTITYAAVVISLFILAMMGIAPFGG